MVSPEPRVEPAAYRVYPSTYEATIWPDRDDFVIEVTRVHSVEDAWVVDRSMRYLGCDGSWVFVPRLRHVVEGEHRARFVMSREQALAMAVSHVDSYKVAGRTLAQGLVDLAEPNNA